jgi:ribulose-5-phosphate 4-epimerase/fuculose-1-phosphate aldolase
MTNIIDGVIKFDFHLFKITGPLSDSYYQEIEIYREKLFKMNLIGEYPQDQIGFGNLSQRISGNEFTITGTQTGKYPHLNGGHYSHVTKCNLLTNSLEGFGPIKPSSEALTHFAIYSSSPNIKFIFHVHHKEIWEYMIAHNYPHTLESVEYGTLEMAEQAKNLIQDKRHGIFVMKGHQDGFVGYGENSQEAFNEILKVYNLVINS